jgi:hypothetical protein
MANKTLRKILMSTLVAGCGTTTPAIVPVEPTFVAPVIDSCAINKQLRQEADGHKVIYNVRENPEQCEDKTFGFAYIVGEDSFSHITYGQKNGRLTARVAGPLEGPMNTANLLKQKGAIYECVNDGSKFDCEFKDKTNLLNYDKHNGVPSLSGLETISASLRSGTAAEHAKFGYELMGELFKK